MFSCVLNANTCNEGQLESFDKFWNDMEDQLNYLIENSNRDKPVCHVICYKDTLMNDIWGVQRSKTLRAGYCSNILEFCSTGLEEQKLILVSNKYPDCPSCMDCNDMIFVNITFTRDKCSSFIPD